MLLIFAVGTEALPALLPLSTHHPAPRLDQRADVGLRLREARRRSGTADREGVLSRERGHRDGSRRRPPPPW